MPRWKPLTVLFTALLLSVQLPARARAQSSDGPESAVFLTIIGKINASDDKTTVTAKGKDEQLDIQFELGFIRTPAFYRNEAQRLDGQTVEIRGALLPRPRDKDEAKPPRSEEDLARHDNYLLVPTRAPRVSKKKHVVRARCEATVEAGRVSIGSEGTGIEFEIAPDSERYWELELSNRHRKLLPEEGRVPIEVHGIVTLRKGIAIPFRWVMTVSELMLRKDN